MPSSGTGILLALFTFFTPHQTAAQAFAAIGERPQGMAGAFVAVADDASAVYWNPAGLAWPTGSTFDAQLGLGDRKVFFAAALPPFGLSYYRLPIVSTLGNRQNEGSGKVPIRTLITNNVGVTVNQTVVNGLVIGTTVRLVHGGFEDRRGRTTVDFDAGALFSAGDFRAGLAARNLREPDFEAETGRLSLERQIRVGVAYAPRALPTGVHGPFTVAVDADLTRENGIFGGRREASAGGEYWVRRGRIGMRGGVRWSTLNEANPGVSGGLTLQLPHSIYLEGHLTHRDVQDESDWGVGARFTF